MALVPLKIENDIFKQFQHYKMIDGLQRPNSSLILTLGKLPLSVSEGLIKFLFEDAKISR